MPALSYSGSLASYIILNFPAQCLIRSKIFLTISGQSICVKTQRGLLKAVAINDIIVVS